MLKHLTLTFLILSMWIGLNAQSVISFEKFDLAPNSWDNGYAATLGSFETDLAVQGVIFSNQYYRSDWGYGLTESFSGFAYSKVQDNTTRGYENQFSCVAGSGADNSSVYGLFYAGFGNETVHFQEAMNPGSLSVCNSTYAYYSMLEGDAFSKKFGGESGNDPDYFLLTITGFLGENQTNSVLLYLADFRFEDNAEDFILSEWKDIDLSALGLIDRLQFGLSSSDNGAWGMNTPAYFCIDNFADATFEDLPFTSGEFWNGASAALGQYSSSFTEDQVSINNTYTLSDWGWGLTGSWYGWTISNATDTTTPGYLNQHSAIAGSGANNTANYAICYSMQEADTLYLEEEVVVESLHVTNSTYAYLAMRDGDSFSKKFGGDSGNDADFMKLTITGLLNGEVTGSIDCYLADFRFEDNSLDYIQQGWINVDLSGLGPVTQLLFKLASSDNGPWGMNTPAYFCLDEIRLSHTMTIEETDQRPEIILFPNPASTTITLNSDSDINRVEVLSMSGQSLLSHRPVHPAHQVVTDISSLAKGVYLVRIFSGTKIFTQRWIKN